MPCLASLSQNSANISKDEDEHLVGLKDIDFANNGIVKGRGINDDRNSDEEFFFQQSAVFDDESLSDSSIEISKLNSLPLEPNFDVHPKKLTEKNDFQGTLTISAKATINEHLRLPINLLPSGENSEKLKKLHSNTYHKATITCKEVFPHLKSLAKQVDHMRNSNSLTEAPGSNDEDTLF